MGSAAPAGQPLDIIQPMLATPGEAPEGDGWAVEFKWDGTARVPDFSPDRGTSRLREKFMTRRPERGNGIIGHRVEPHRAERT